MIGLYNILGLPWFIKLLKAPIEKSTNTVPQRRQGGRRTPPFSLSWRVPLAWPSTCPTTQRWRQFPSLPGLIFFGTNGQSEKMWYQTIHEDKFNNLYPNSIFDSFHPQYCCWSKSYMIAYHWHTHVDARTLNIFNIQVASNTYLKKNMAP